MLQSSDAQLAALQFDSEWSLGEDAYRAVVADIRSIDGQQIVEFGSGISTIRFTHDFPTGSVYSVEGDPAWFQETKKLQQHKGTGEIAIDLRPLTFQLHANALYESYAPGPFPSDVDAVLIDGPPMETRRGREACLYQIMAKLKVGGRIYLDDYCRSFEQRVVQNWQHSYPNAIRLVEVLDVGHQVCVLEKTAPAAKPRSSATVLLDTAGQNARRAFFFVRRKLGVLPASA